MAYKNNLFNNSNSVYGFKSSNMDAEYSVELIDSIVIPAQNKFENNSSVTYVRPSKPNAFNQNYLNSIQRFAEPRIVRRANNPSARGNTSVMNTSAYKENILKAVKYLNALKETDNIPEQIQNAVPVLCVIKSAMKELNPESQQYAQFSLMLVMTMVIDKNGEELFTEKQIDAMTGVVNDCEDGNIDKETYLRHYDLLTENGFEMIRAEDD